MTLFQVEELTSYWAQHPPLHLLVAAFLGLGKDKQKQLPPTSAQRGQQTGSDAMLSELGTGSVPETSTPAYRQWSLISPN